jgi:hypothetical protein
MKNSKNLVIAVVVAVLSVFAMSCSEENITPQADGSSGATGSYIDRK